MMLQLFYVFEGRKARTRVMSPGAIADGIRFGLLYFCDCFDLYDGTAGELLNSEAASCRGSCEVFCIYGIECCEICDIGKEAGGLYYQFCAGAASLNQCLYLLASHVSCFSDLAHAGLSGNENETVSFDCRCIGSDGSGTARDDYFFHVCTS